MSKNAFEEKRERTKKVKKITLCAAMAALGVVIMYIGALFELFDLCTIFVASLFVCFAVIEFGVAWAWGTFFVSAFLAVLLVPNNFTAWEYALVVGLLPILKYYFEKVQNRILSFTLKWGSFNVLFTLVLLLFEFILQMQFERVEFYGFVIEANVMPIVLYVLGNICYLLYDLLLTRLIVLYYALFHEKIQKKLGMKND